MNGDYWIGADGNYYIKTSTSNGVQNLGAATPDNPNVDVINGLTRIADPNPPAAVSAPAPTNPTGATHPALNQGAVNNTQLAIDQIPGLLASALGSEDTSYGNAKNAFNAQETQQRGTYDKSTTTNQQNYDSNFMDSIRAGIKGLGSLMTLLRGSGAAGGSVDKTVRDVVGGTTADDIRTGADTQKGNQASLDSTLGQFLTDLKTKRAQNDDTHANNDAAITRDSNTQLQDLYSKMAGFYGDAGDTGTANDFMAKAGGLTPAIAANSRTQTSAYDTTPVAVQAPQITAFAAPTQPNVATAPENGQVGSGIFAISKPKKDTTTPQVTAPVAAAAGA